MRQLHPDNLPEHPTPDEKAELVQLFGMASMFPEDAMPPGVRDLMRQMAVKLRVIWAGEPLPTAIAALVGRFDPE
jgi:hypothetical protein